MSYELESFTTLEIHPESLQEGPFRCPDIDPEELVHKILLPNRHQLDT